VASIPWRAFNTHNHPLFNPRDGKPYAPDDPRNAGHSFSPEDCQFAASKRASETRVVTPNTLFVLRPGAQGWLPIDWKSRVEKVWYRSTDGLEGWLSKRLGRKPDDSDIVYWLVAKEGRHVTLDLWAAVEERTIRGKDAEARYSDEVIRNVSRILDWDYRVYPI